MLTLLIGDFFIPERVIDIPAKFRKLLSPNAPAVPSNAKISQVLCLGNITQSASTLRFLHDLSPLFYAVRGEFDDATLVGQQIALLDSKNDTNLPFYRVITADNFRIGFTSGYQIVPRNDPLSLLAFAREIDVDILVWGGTHRVEAYTLDGKFFISPGSATGAFSMNWPDLEDEDEEEEEEEEEEYKRNEEKVGSNSDGQEKEPTADETEENTSQTTKEDSSESGKAEDLGEKSGDEEEFDDSHLTSSLPSFCLMDTNLSRCTLYIYTYINDEVKVDKIMYSKE
ncbi:hypothetical protein OXX59_003563 [Metschnikowia pulcherrima]